MEYIMSKKMLIDAAHPEEVRIGLTSDGKLDKFDFETASKTQVKGNIYLAKVIRVEPSLQAAFIDYGGNRHGFLSFSEISHDYFQIPVGDREELDAHLQNAIASYAAETEQSIDDLEPKEIAKLRYQFYRKYKIQEVIKKRQIMLVQVTKEERGNKGAAVTTYISLAGRYCVLMPNTAKGSGVSRKVTNSTDRMKLKKIVSGLSVPNGSVVIRTAGVGHTKSEITKDFDYLTKLWNEIRETTLRAIAPCLIHEESSLIKRSIRDMYTKDIDEIVVEGEEGYKTAKNFMKKLMPSHSKKVKLHDDSDFPLFSKYKLNEQINQIYSTRVDLPSGGYIIINNTEALISIDVNSGKSTKERNISGTALKTNLEAAVEIARQCRLRDLAGLIVVDFIDMDEKRNNSQVEKQMREALRSDKAKIQVGTISNFGLLEFSRQRLRSSIVDANMVNCPYCRGTGFMWTDESLSVQLLRKIEESCSGKNIKEVKVTLSPNVALYLLNCKRPFLSMIESRGNLKIYFNTDSGIAPVDFRIEPVVERQMVNEVNADDSIVDANVQDSGESVVDTEKKSSRKTTRISREKNSKKVEIKIDEPKSEALSDDESPQNETKVKTVKTVSKKKGNPSPRKEEDTSLTADSHDNVENQSVMSVPVKKTSKNSIMQRREGSIDGSRRQTRKKRENEEENQLNKSLTEKIVEPGMKMKSSAKSLEQKPELKEGKVDFNAFSFIDEHQKELTNKMLESYRVSNNGQLDMPENFDEPKKKTGWWQRLLKKS
ncbi:MAG: ribonuclease E/G [Alphaproteobacteria bacterium]|nr:ribonuclease E/G [Alphaproteobacteria bacterium]